jgi:plasmid maintenance system antidote protein VapI
MECRHLDGDPMNNRVENLTWGTRAENMHDRTRHGTDNGGERNQWAKLTNDQVVEIRERYIAGGIKQATLAAMYGVGVPAISTIVTGKAYVDAGGPISRTQTAEDLGRRVAKLTDTQVREIRDKAKQPGVRGKDLAVEYGVSRSTISRICGGYPRRGVS